MSQISETFLFNRKSQNTKSLPYTESQGCKEGWKIYNFVKQDCYNVENSMVGSIENKDFKLNVMTKCDEYYEPGTASVDDGREEVDISQDDKETKVNTLENPSENSSEYEVFVTVEGKFPSQRIITQMAAICSDSDASYHATYCNKTSPVRILHVFHDGTQLKRINRRKGNIKFMSFIQDLIDEKKKENKTVTLVFYSKYEVGLFVSGMKWGQLVEKSSNTWQKYGVWDLACQDVKLVYLRSEEFPPNLSDLCDEYHDSMLEAVKILKRFVQGHPRTQVNTCSLSIFLRIRPKGTNRFPIKIISCMNLDIPKQLNLQLVTIRGSEEMMERLKSSYVAPIPLNENRKRKKPTDLDAAKKIKL